MDARDAIILFDGHCNLCSGSVRFIIKRDPHARFRFASLQSDAAQRACADLGETALPSTDPTSIILIDRGRARLHSDAALAIAARLRFPWPLLTVLRIIPRPLRDWAYRTIARNRYRWFGRTETCLVPTNDLLSRFLN